MKIIHGSLPLFLLSLLFDFVPAGAPTTGTDLVREAGQERVDIGLFARVVTSDPARNDGARSGRLDEFPAEDVFLDREAAPSADGRYVVPAWPDGKACIGIRWDERRMLTRLELSLAGSSPAPARQIPEVQYWSSEGREDSWSGIGQTAWQGKWKRLPGKIEVRGDRLAWQVSRGDVPEFRQATGTLAVRWVFSGGPASLRVRRPAAWSDSRWATGDFRCEMPPGKVGGPVTVSVYNGQLLQGETGSGSLQRVWDPVKPIVLTIRYAVPEQRKADRTLVRFATPAGGFSAALEDVLSTDGIYVPDYGVYLARHAAGLTLDRYLENHRDRRTILQQVRKLPEQTLDRAMQALWRPIQNNGPTMLSLAADNEKFVVDRDGTIRHGALTVAPLFQEGRPQTTRHLEGRWLPIVMHETRHGELICKERVYVAPAERSASALSMIGKCRAVGVAEFSIENVGPNKIDQRLGLSFRLEKGEGPVLEVTGGRAIVKQGSRVMACVEFADPFLFASPPRMASSCFPE